jgi:poly-gamma-glutamate system protein
VNPIARLRAWLAWISEPFVKPRVPLAWLALAALLSVGFWLGVEQFVRARSHPEKVMLVAAANAAAAAAAAIARTKAKAGLMPDAGADPNRTGLIGPEWSEIVTTIGDLQAKRTVTNPNLAAAIARVLMPHAKNGAAVGLVLSGSFVGANVAAIAAVETLGLRPVIVTSLGASMYGAADPDFTWLDMEAVVARAGIWQARSTAVVLGGESALGNSLSDTGRTLLIDAAHRNGYEPVQAADFAALKAQIHAVLAKAAPAGVAALISAGGSVLAMGTCLDAYRLPSGSVQGKLPCQDGVPGLMHDFANRNVPVVHILNVKRLALDWGLPYDPIPLPPIGQNARIYGRMAFP